MLVGEEVDQPGLEVGRRAVLRHRHGGGDGRHDVLAAPDRGEPDEEGAIGEPCLETMGGVQAQGGLPGATGADEGGQPGGADALAQRGEQLLAPDERGQVGREVGELRSGPGVVGSGRRGGQGDLAGGAERRVLPEHPLVERAQ